MRGLVRTDRNRKDLDFPPVISASMDMLRGYINNVDCLFFASSGTEVSDLQLHQDIESGGLSYISAVTEHGKLMYCVMNNYYPTDCFLKLGSYWCRRNHLKGALVTIPEGDKAQNYKLTVYGKRFDRNGEVINTLTSTSIDDVEEFLIEMFGEEVKVESADIRLTSLKPFQGTAGFVIALRKFKEKYPELEGNKNENREADNGKRIQNL